MARKIKRKELSVKTKHIFIAVLSILAIIVLGASVTLYNYKEKFDIYNLIANSNSQYSKEYNLKDYTTFSVQECKNIECKIKVGVANAVYEKNEESCEGDIVCLDHYYREKAIAEENGDYCGKIQNKGVKDNCYYTLYLLTNNKEYCEAIESNFLKENCQ